MSETLPTREEYEDRLTDQGLAEVLGSKRPPDLSDDILAAAKYPRWYARRALRLAVAASVFIAAGAGAFLYMHRGGDTSTNPSLVALNERLSNISPSDPESQALHRGAEMRIIDEASISGKGIVQNEFDIAPSGGANLGAPLDLADGTEQPSRFDTDMDVKFQTGDPVDSLQLGSDYLAAKNPQPVTRFGRTIDAKDKTVRDFTVPTRPAPQAGSETAQGVTDGRWFRGESVGRRFDLAKARGLATQDGETPWGEGAGQAGDRHSRIVENPFLAVSQNPLSTFSIDVDTASYAKTRRYLLQANMLPPPDAVRIEELVNYFSYDYPGPEGKEPFSAHVEVAACPWQPEHRLLHVGLKGKKIEAEDRPASNLVFLLDVSGSMEPEDRLPRVRRAMRMLVEQLSENDRVAIVVYAGASGLVLPSTPGYQKEKILSALENLQAGGSTNGASGIHLAYDTAAAQLIKGGTNRVVLCTDGDFNVGVTSTADLERLAEEKAKSGVFLTVLGFGMGNHNDDLLEKLADKGNGNYGYVDSEQEAKKLLVDELGGTLVTIAKDVKIQIEFNPRQVSSYRLIGYENRLLRAEDFNDDKKDAGEIGAGHSVTALYELVPAGSEIKAVPVDELKYQQQNGATEAAASGELLTLKLRYKDPDGQESHEPLVFPVKESGHAFGQASVDFKFASAVASFGMLLRNSEHQGETSYDAVLEIAAASLGPDQHGYRAGFLEMVRKAKTLTGK